MSKLRWTGDPNETGSARVRIVWSWDTNELHLATSVRDHDGDEIATHTCKLMRASANVDRLISELLTVLREATQYQLALDI